MGQTSEFAASSLIVRQAASSAIEDLAENYVIKLLYGRPSLLMAGFAMYSLPQLNLIRSTCLSAGNTTNNSSLNFHSIFTDLYNINLSKCE